MARRTKPCDFCADDCWNTEEGCLGTGHQLSVEIYPDSNIIYIASFANDECGESEELEAQIEMNYCPVCGRKLGW